MMFNISAGGAGKGITDALRLSFASYHRLITLPRNQVVKIPGISNGKTKNKILGCIFSEKLHFEDGKVAAPTFTTPIDVLICASGVLGGCKKKEVISDLLPILAPEAGLEPATL